MTLFDIHSHAWPFPGAFNDDFMRQARAARAGMEVSRGEVKDNLQAFIEGRA